MPLFYFVLKDGRQTIADREGTELPDQDAARTHAIAVARELMRSREAVTQAWRLEVCDDYLRPRFEILFAEVDDSYPGLPPHIKETRTTVARSVASLHDALATTRESLQAVRDTFVRADQLITYVAQKPPLQER